MSVFIRVFESLGYQVCPDGDSESGYEKVVIYAMDGEPKHAARQEPETGMWLSKLGQSYDVAHRNVKDLSGSVYGDPVCYLRKPLEA